MFKYGMDDIMALENDILFSYVGGSSPAPPTKI